ACDRIVRNGSCPFCVRCANRNDIRIVTGRCDGAIAFRVQGVITARIPRSDNDNDPGVPCSFLSLAERIECVAFIYLAPERQINYTDVVGALESNGLLNGGDDVTFVAAAILIQYAEINELHIRSHALEGPAE